MPFSALDQLISRSIEEGFPSAQLLVAHNNVLVKHRSYGYATLSPNKVAASLDTLYDIASLTKIFSITYAFQYLVSWEGYDLEQTLREIFPEHALLLMTQDKSNISVRALLAHEAGFEANPHYYDSSYSAVLYSQNDRAGFIEKLLMTPLIHAPFSKVLYSDVDYMLLTFILEKHLVMPLDVWLAKTFWQPMGLTDIFYQPLDNGVVAQKIAATELKGNTRDGGIVFDNIRQEVIRGVVQDEKAYHCMAGVSGHAGLFANTKALYPLLNLMQTENEFFSALTKKAFLTSSGLDASFGLGWRLNKGAMSFSFGDYASTEAFGHTGWTGCVMLVDPAVNLLVIYLTNRKHTPVLDPHLAPNIFLGDTLPAGNYRTIINEIYRALELI